MHRASLRGPLIRSILLVATLAGFGGIGAMAQPVMHTLETSMEGALLESLHLNRHRHGEATIRPCQECAATLSLRVTPETRFEIHGAPLPERDLARLTPAMVTVFYLEPQRELTKVMLHALPR